MTKTAIVALVSLLFASALSAQAAPSAALGEARVALVIGNGAYPNVPSKTRSTTPTTWRGRSRALASR